jgi:hypothetical protein
MSMKGGGVEYSIFFTASSSGLQTINLLKAPTTLVGAMFSGQYLGIVIDSVKTAYIPNISFNGLDTPMIPVTNRFEGLQINVVFQFSGQVGVLYFGTPTSDAIPLVAYSGSVVSISGTNSGSAAANVTASGTLSFPQGNVKLTGIAYLSLDGNSSYDTWSFTTAGGLLIEGFGIQCVGAGGRFSVLPLNSIFTAQSLTISVLMNSVKASSTHSVLIIGYYAF